MLFQIFCRKFPRELENSRYAKKRDRLCLPRGEEGERGLVEQIGTNDRRKAVKGESYIYIRVSLVEAVEPR